MDPIGLYVQDCRAVLVGDPQSAGLKEYLTEWLRKYPGRGISDPSLDVVLATCV